MTKPKLSLCTATCECRPFLAHAELGLSMSRARLRAGSSLHFSAHAFVISQTQYRIVTVLGIVPNFIRSVVFWRPDIKDCFRVVTFQGPFVQFRICTQDFIFRS